MIKAFEQLDEEAKILAKKLKTELRVYHKIPAWVCEYHQEVLPYIYRAIGSKHLPFFGLTMVHFDSHPDLMAPSELKADLVYDKELLFDLVSIADWILPAVYVGHISKVIWVKPPWAKQIEDKTIVFHVGRHERDGVIRVSCCEQYFCEDGLYAPLEELENCKELVVVIMTMNFDDLFSNDSFGSQNLEQTSAVDLSTNILLPNNGNNLMRKDYKRSLEYFISGLLSQLKEPFILDIDMDFFSTLNPFEVMFTKEEFEVLSGFYSFPVCNSGLEKDLKDLSDKHQKNVKELEATLTFVKNGCDGDVHNSINNEFMKFIKKWREAQTVPVDFEMVHSAGMTTNLPVHISSKQEVTKMMNHLKQTLVSLPKPTIITIARSSDDDYTPPQSVEMIQELLITCLTECYNDDVEWFLAYKDE